MSSKQRLVLSIIDFLNQSIQDGTVKQDDKESLEVASTSRGFFVVFIARNLTNHLRFLCSPVYRRGFRRRPQRPGAGQPPLGQARQPPLHLRCLPEDQGQARVPRRRECVRVHFCTCRTLCDRQGCCGEVQGHRKRTHVRQEVRRRDQVVYRGDRTRSYQRRLLLESRGRVLQQGRAQLRSP
ncbi:hypothetical protein GY45DRAFT_586782 [Cubamyces sp. BRFM 1775]|nr:hypothetical protein GY45DRAFT_586782 [Cubamyces sp. BRFM 1775]